MNKPVSIKSFWNMIYLVMTTPLDKNTAQALNSLYEENFPPHDRRTESDFFYQLARSKRISILTSTPDEPIEKVPYLHNSHGLNLIHMIRSSIKGPIIGFSITWEMPGWVFIEHICISSKAQGQGLGTRLMQYLLTRYSGHPVVLEIENPDGHANDSPNYKRVRFYERLLFERVPNSHFTPIYPGQQEPQNLILMTHPNDSDSIPSLDQMHSLILSQVYEAVPEITG